MRLFFWTFLMSSIVFIGIFSACMAVYEGPDYDFEENKSYMINFIDELIDGLVINITKMGEDEINDLLENGSFQGKDLNQTNFINKKVAKHDGIVISSVKKGVFYYAATILIIFKIPLHYSVAWGFDFGRFTYPYNRGIASLLMNTILGLSLAFKWAIITSPAWIIGLLVYFHFKKKKVK